MKAKQAIDQLTAAGNALGLEGRFGARWGFAQLRERLVAAERAIMTDDPLTTMLRLVEAADDSMF